MEATVSEVLRGDSVRINPVPIKVYKRRWWILFLYAALGFMQCSVWNTWGPITGSVKEAFPSWSDSTIALLSMWGTITMMLGLIPFTILLQKYGLRRCILLTSFLMALGTSLRIITTDDQPFTILAHICSVFNGFAGIIIGIAPSLLSSLWFPMNERTTATAIGCTFNQLGNAGGFFIGPIMVDDPYNYTANKTINIDSTVIKREIYDYMWIVSGVCVGIFILVLAYFPDKPKKPPSVSTYVQSEERGKSLKEQLSDLIKNRNFWLLLIPYSLTLGVNVAWSSVIDINVAPYGITQGEAGWMGMYVTFGGVVMAVLVSLLTDMLFGYIKVTILVLLTISTIFFTWFMFITVGLIEFDKTQLFVSIIIGTSFSYGCSPLFFEMAVELAYPVSEAIVGCMLNLGWNLVSFLFLMVLQTPASSVVWMDYVLCIQGIVCLIFMILVKEKYRRSYIDRAVTSVEDNSPDTVEDRSFLETSMTVGLLAS